MGISSSKIEHYENTIDYNKVLSMIDHANEKTKYNDKYKALIRIDNIIKNYNYSNFIQFRKYVSKVKYYNENNDIKSFYGLLDDSYTEILNSLKNSVYQVSFMEQFADNSRLNELSKGDTFLLDIDDEYNEKIVNEILYMYPHDEQLRKLYKSNYIEFINRFFSLYLEELKQFAKNIDKSSYLPSIILTKNINEDKLKLYDFITSIVAKDTITDISRINKFKQYYNL